MKRRDFLIESACTAVGALAFPCADITSAAGAAEPNSPQRGRPARGPLRAHPDNPRYFTDGTGRAVYLTGSHTWYNLLDMGKTDPPPRFDYDSYLNFLERHHHNFIRLWTWEPVTWDTSSNQPAGGQVQHAAPQPWARTGPGEALDGKPKFDLARFDPEYFDRLRSRVIAAGERGIYVSVMLFEGWALQFSPGAWEGHPLNSANNVNGIDGDSSGDGKGIEVHTLARRELTAIQEAYVQKVVDTVNDLDNALYEISNENHPPSTDWQYHMIRCIHDYERGKPKQHPVGMTFQYRGGRNRTLFDSPADWVSPNPEGGYRDNPPAADGSKIVISDTDHLWGIGGNQAWVWKSFLRGLNPIFMDPYDGIVLGKRFDPQWDPIRRSMGYTLRFADRMDLVAMTPHNELASTKYCLANPGTEYLVYLPAGGTVRVDLTAASGKLTVEWFDPMHDKTIDAGATAGGRHQEFRSPVNGDAVLYLAASKSNGGRG